MQTVLLQFQTGLPSAVTTQLRATSESYDLEKALERAKLLMTIKDEEQTAAVKQKNRLLELDELNIHQLAEIAAPLHHLMQKNVPFAWNNYCQMAFDSLKERLSQVPILSYPEFGPSAVPFVCIQMPVPQELVLFWNITGMSLSMLSLLCPWPNC